MRVFIRLRFSNINFLLCIRQTQYYSITHHYLCKVLIFAFVYFFFTIWYCYITSKRGDTLAWTQCLITKDFWLRPRADPCHLYKYKMAYLFLLDFVTKNKNLYCLGLRSCSLDWTWYINYYKSLYIVFYSHE